MKNIIALSMLTCTCLLFACNGNHSDRTVRDTAANTHDSVPSNIDTSKTTTTTGSAGAVDDGASGGTKIAKPDTPKK
jgi:hypothetical protein